MSCHHCFWNLHTVDSWCSKTEGFSYGEPKVRHMKNTVTIGILWYEFVTNEEVATLSQLLPINKAVSWRRHSLFGHVRHSTRCLLHTKVYTSKSWHGRAQDSLALGENNHENGGWSRSPQCSLLLMLGVLRHFGQHGGHYDPSMVKRRERTST